MIKVLLFDLGGVYLNQGLNDFKRNLGNSLKLPLSTIRKVMEENIPDLYIGRLKESEFWSKLINELKIDSNTVTLRGQLLDSYVVNSEVREIVQKLRGKYKTVLLSDFASEWILLLDKKLNFAKDFYASFFSFEMGVPKKDINFFRKAINELKVAASECISIDDLKDNLIYAKKLGIKTILFKSPYQLIKELQRYGIQFPDVKI